MKIIKTLSVVCVSLVLMGWAGVGAQAAAVADMDNPDNGNAVVGETPVEDEENAGSAESDVDSESVDSAGKPDKPWSGDDMEGVDVPWERMVFGLLFVLILVCVGVYCLKRFGGARFGNGRYMNVIETVPLSGQASLSLVKIGERVVLLAVEKEHVEKVAEFEADDLPEPQDVETSPESGFSGVLEGLMKGQK